MKRGENLNFEVIYIFELVNKIENKYLVLDTSDGVVDEASWEELIDYLQLGVEIEGCHKTDRGYHFDIDNSNYQVILRGYKFRLFPDVKQREYFEKCFGCCRFIWNKMLADKIKHYEITKENLITYPADYKDEFPFLKEVDSQALNHVYLNLDKAFTNFFRNKDFGFPKFKSKKNNYKSFTTDKVEIIYDKYLKTMGRKPHQITFRTYKPRVKKKYIKLPKSSDFGLVKIRLNQNIKGNIKTVTISQVPSGKYYASFQVETWYQAKPQMQSIIGVDLGIKDLVITSDGFKFENPKTLQKHQKRLMKLQRQLAHKQKGSKNYEKARIRLAREYERISNIRKNHIHKISNKLISENQVIISEKLNIRGMLKNHHLARSIADASWYELTRQLAYKALWNFRTYYQVNTYFPSSQICSCCGYQYGVVKDLSIRTWTCPNCGAVHDRDENAAINIKNKGIQDLGLLMA